MGDNHKELIRKLLALAESSNEHEAKAALLKARELMAKHKLTEEELKDESKRTVKKMLTDVTCSKRRNPWAIQLSAVIGENYCCKAYQNHVKGKQTMTIGFIGLDDDVEICSLVFGYAVDCILSRIKGIKKENSQYQRDYVRELSDSYGYGFTVGVETVFQNQKEENEWSWGLVMAIPKEVEEYAQSLGKAKFRARAQERIRSNEYAEGYSDGKAFNPTKRPAEA